MALSVINSTSNPVQQKQQTNRRKQAQSKQTINHRRENMTSKSTRTWGNQNSSCARLIWLKCRLLQLLSRSWFSALPLAIPASTASPLASQSPWWHVREPLCMPGISRQNGSGKQALSTRVDKWGSKRNRLYLDVRVEWVVIVDNAQTFNSIQSSDAVALS